MVHQTVAILKDFEDSAQSPSPPIYQPDWFSEEKSTNTSSNGTEISKQHENEHDSYEGIEVWFHSTYSIYIFHYYNSWKGFHIRLVFIS